MIELGAGFDPNLTAEENIFINGAILGHNRAFMREHYEEIVDFAELHKFMGMPIKNYSSGMRARLGFAVATMVKPDILVVDEVLAVGDAAFQKSAWIECTRCWKVERRYCSYLIPTRLCEACARTLYGWTMVRSG